MTGRISLWECIRDSGPFTLVILVETLMMEIVTKVNANLYVSKNSTVVFVV